MPSKGPGGAQSANPPLPFPYCPPRRLIVPGTLLLTANVNELHPCFIACAVRGLNAPEVFPEPCCPTTMIPRHAVGKSIHTGASCSGELDALRLRKRPVA